MEEHVKSALIEDIGYGDITTENLAEEKLTVFFAALRFLKQFINYFLMM